MFEKRKQLLLGSNSVSSCGHSLQLWPSLIIYGAWHFLSSEHLRHFIKFSTHHQEAQLSITFWISHYTFEDYMGILFIESLMIGTEHLYLWSSQKNTVSHLCKTGKYLLIVISKEKMWFFPMLRLLWSCSTLSFCLLYTCSVTISCYHAVSSNIKYDL